MDGSRIVKPKQENKKPSLLNMLKSRLKHGLLLLTVRNLLMRLGLDIEPYYIEQESSEFCELPKIKDEVSLYSLKIVNDEILKKQFEFLGWSSDLLEKIIQSEHYCLGLYRGQELAAFMIATLKQFDVKGRIIPLSPKEAYLEYMYTFENFRGRNIAPYLRYKTYKLLQNKGIQDFYSMSQYFNNSSLKFKKKLGAKHKEFWLHIGLFKSLKWNFLLKDYGKGKPIDIKA